MFSQKAILCKLGGKVNSNPEILSSFPPLEATVDDMQEIMTKCLPIGSKSGDFVMTKYKDNSLLAYIFRVKTMELRDDLMSISILIDKKLEPEFYQPILKIIVSSLDEEGLLNEEILKRYQQNIYEAINKEMDLKIESITIPLSEQFKSINSKIKKEKPNLRGSFF